MARISFLRYGSHPLWRVAVIAALTLLACLHALGTVPISALDDLDRWIYDIRQRMNLIGGHDDRIVIVQVDERSLAVLGQWPWPRQVLSNLVQELHGRQQAAAIGIDAVFAESQRNSLHPDLQGALPDEQFQNALLQSNTVIGYYFTSDRMGFKSGALPSPMALVAGPSPAGMLEWDGYGSNLPSLMRSGVTAGFFNAVQDPDGMVRSIPVLAVFNENKSSTAYYESFSLAVLRQALSVHSIKPTVKVRLTRGKISSLELLSLVGGPPRLTIPLNANGTSLVPYRGSGGAQDGVFKYLSAIDVIEQKIPPASLSGRIALVGFTAPGLMDLRATPVSQAYPGVEVHASLIAGMLDSRLPIIPSWIPMSQALILLVMGTFLAVSLLIWQLGRRIAYSALMLLGLIGANIYLYRQVHLVLPLATPLVLIFATVVVNLALGYWLENRAKQDLARQFAAYVPPELVRQMQINPSHYTMHARTQEVTVMFCDIRGFTDMAEKMDPLALQSLLNELFARLTQAIQAHKGTIDKYMGDCVMAFWGAPVLAPDHAACAIGAAVSMRQTLAQFNKERLDAGLPTVGAGIGINTGTVAVGDMGSSLRRSYTVIGDAVNLASRLEHLTQLYGIDLIVGQRTQAQAPEWVWQEIDHVRVKGRHQTLSIYTVRCEQQHMTPELQRELDLWNKALTHWRDKDYTACLVLIEQLLDIAPTSGLYLFYARQLQNLGHQRTIPENLTWEI